MLKKIYKLKSLEIKNLLNKKETPFKVIRGVFFDIKIFKNKNEASNIIKNTIITSSKNFKKAVTRNKIRRRIYTILEYFLKENEINLEKHISIIIYPKKEVINIKFSDLKKELYNSLNILKNK